jgi:hypothetical protein
MDKQYVYYNSIEDQIWIIPSNVFADMSGILILLGEL